MRDRMAQIPIAGILMAASVVFGQRASARQATPAAQTGSATVAEALGKLGLKMEKTRANVEDLVVERVEKMLTEN